MSKRSLSFFYHLTTCLLFCVMLSGCGGGKSKSNQVSLPDQEKKADAITDPTIRANKLLVIAGKYNERVLISDSERVIDKVMKATDEIEDDADRSGLLINISAQLAEMKLRKQAESTLVKAEEALAKTEEDADKAKNLADLAIANHRLGKRDKFSSNLEEAKKIGLKVEDPKLRATTLMTLLETYNEAKDQTGFDGLTGEIKQYAADQGDARTEVDILALLAKSVHSLGQKDKAKEIFTESISKAEALENAEAKAYAYLEIARAYTLSNQKSTSGTMLKKAEDAKQKIKDNGVKNAVNEAIGNIERQNKS